MYINIFNSDSYSNKHMKYLCNNEKNNLSFTSAVPFHRHRYRGADCFRSRFRVSIAKKIIWKIANCETYFSLLLSPKCI
jgi:hypothetical protein